MHEIKPLSLEQKIGLKQMMNQEEHTMLIVRLNLNLLCQNLSYVITAMHISFVKELLVLATVPLQILMQTMLIKR